MKKKQIIGIVVATLAFIAIGITNMYSQKISGAIFPFDDLEGVEGEYIGQINIEGAIIGGESGSVFGSEEGYDHQFILDSIQECEDDEDNKGILLYINSPGGTVNASDEVYLELMEYKKNTERPIWVYMGDEACSGGYYIAMAGDKIYANRNTWTGSIGVYIELVNYSGLMEKIGVETVYFTTGANKTMGSGTKELTEEQKVIFQNLVNEPYQQFLGIVEEGRPKMTSAEVKKAADGRIYTAKQALDIGLIDKLGMYKDVADDMVEKYAEDGILYEYNQELDWFSELYASAKGLKQKSAEEVLVEYMKKNGSGEAMYYAMPGQ